jgi:hypothetical protein
MIHAIRTFLLSGRLAKAQRERIRAWESHRQAVARGDTRTIHYTRKALFTATTEKLRLELGR